MRTTVNLDSDAYDFAFAYARGKGMTLSAAMSELLRRAEQAPEPESGRLIMNQYGFFEIADTGHKITPAMVKEASEDELV